MPKKNKKPLLYYAYENIKSRCKTLVYCPLCERRSIPLKKYQNHCLESHNLNHRKCCVYCFGNVTWSHGQKMNMGGHLSECFRKFENLYRTDRVISNQQTESLSASTSSEMIEPVDMITQEEDDEEENHSATDESAAMDFENQLQNGSVYDAPLICSKRCFTFGSFEKYSSKNFWNKWPIEDQEGARLMEEPLFESNVESLNFTESDVKLKYESASGTKDKEKWLALLNPLRFDRLSGLADVPSWIYRYLFTSWSTNNEKHRTWYHLCVRAGCMKSFVEAVKELDIVAAPYWCVCDGGVKFDQQESLAKTHHRHFIVAVKNQAKFHNALRRNIVFEGSGPPPEPGFKKYYAKLIKTANHFVATVAYVSLPHSKCRCKDLMNKGEGREEDSDNPVLTFWRGYSRGPRHEGHYLVRNKVVWHAVWWMLLLVPSEGIDKFAQFCSGRRNVFGMKSRRLVGNRWMLSAADELRMKNCVVRFDPSNIKIDVDNPIDNLKTYLDMPTWFACGSPYEERRPFVYWFDGKIFPVKWMVLPEFEDEEDFQIWHATREINTLLNPGCDSLFRMPRKQVGPANDLEIMKKECTAFFQAKLVEQSKRRDEIERRLRKDKRLLREQLDRLQIQALKQENQNLKLNNCRLEENKCRLEENNCRLEENNCRLEEKNRHLEEKMCRLEERLKMYENQICRLEQRLKMYENQTINIRND